MERSYLIEWKIEIIAENSAAAVKEAVAIMKDPNTTATWFQITNLKNNKTMVIDCEKILFPERFEEKQNGQEPTVRGA